MENNKLWYIILGSLILISILTGCEKNEGNIKIGFIGPLTGSASIYGLENKKSVELAVNEINEKGGINGHKLDLIIEDGKCNGKDALTAANRLIDVEDVKIIIGGVCSSETLAIAPIANEKQVLLFSGASRSPAITTAGDYVFRNSPSDIVLAAITADFVFNNKNKEIAIISENTDFAQGFKSVFMKRYTELGGEILIDEIYAPETTDFKSQITKILSLNPGAILIIPQGTSGGLVVKQLKELGFSGQLYGNNIMAGSGYLEKFGDYVEGLYFSDVSGLDVSNEKVSSLLQKFERIYGSKPQYDYYVGSHYDAVYIIKMAMEEVGYDPEKIKNYLYGLEYDGLLGRYTFDSNGDIVGVKFDNRQVMDGNVKIL